eukprot:CAMPEP_0184481308 /NCGR_PEP_ID=MMETSP0113_2-20130426/2855_1 /TAXON_ID=91329 /ORGANISM="Norrisiella sphaerica, Strain BC52" /LENGTH=1041 /DNA_ID=CAMNT_0026860353 /DNA_START=584 /DNA_END=3709 /DNA_ORIENTATION=+
MLAEKSGLKESLNQAERLLSKQGKNGRREKGGSDLNRKRSKTGGGARVGERKRRRLDQPHTSPTATPTSPLCSSSITRLEMDGLPAHSFLTRAWDADCSATNKVVINSPGHSSVYECSSFVANPDGPVPQHGPTGTRTRIALHHTTPRHIKFSFARCVSLRQPGADKERARAKGGGVPSTGKTETMTLSSGLAFAIFGERALTVGCQLLLEISADGKVFCKRRSKRRVEENHSRSTGNFVDGTPAPLAFDAGETLVGLLLLKNEKTKCSALLLITHSGHILAIASGASQHSVDYVQSVLPLPPHVQVDACCGTGDGRVAICAGGSLYVFDVFKDHEYESGELADMEDRVRSGDDDKSERDRKDYGSQTNPSNTSLLARSFHLVRQDLGMTMVRTMCVIDSAQVAASPIRGSQRDMSSRGADPILILIDEGGRVITAKVSEILLHDSRKALATALSLHQENWQGKGDETARILQQSESQAMRSKEESCPPSGPSASSSASGLSGNPSIGRLLHKLDVLSLEAHRVRALSTRRGYTLKSLAAAITIAAAQMPGRVKALKPLRKLREKSEINSFSLVRIRPEMMFPARSPARQNAKMLKPGRLRLQVEVLGHALPECYRNSLKHCQLVLEMLPSSGEARNAKVLTQPLAFGIEHDRHGSHTERGYSAKFEYDLEDSFRPLIGRVALVFDFRTESETASREGTFLARAPGFARKSSHLDTCEIELESFLIDILDLLQNSPPFDVYAEALRGGPGLDMLGPNESAQPQVPSLRSSAIAAHKSRLEFGRVEEKKVAEIAAGNIQNHGFCIDVYLPLMRPRNELLLGGGAELKGIGTLHKHICVKVMEMLANSSFPATRSASCRLSLHPNGKAEALSYLLCPSTMNTNTVSQKLIPVYALSVNHTTGSPFVRIELSTIDKNGGEFLAAVHGAVLTRLQRHLRERRLSDSYFSESRLKFDKLRPKNSTPDPEWTSPWYTRIVRRHLPVTRLKLVELGVKIRRLLAETDMVISDIHQDDSDLLLAFQRLEDIRQRVVDLRETTNACDIPI